MAARALVLAPHPDDAEIGMGGTIAKLIAAGESVMIADLTNGEPTPHGSVEIRERETAAASKVLGVTQRVNLGIKNREIFDTVETREKVASLIRQQKPELLFVPYWEDGHPDHVQACALCEAARFYSKFVKTSMPGEPWYPRKILHYFSTHIRPTFKPAFVFDISGFLDQKIKALECYHSQFTAHAGNANVLEQLRTENKYWGQQLRVAAGEPFACRELMRVSLPSGLFDV